MASVPANNKPSQEIFSVGSGCLFAKWLKLKSGSEYIELNIDDFLPLYNNFIIKSIVDPSAPNLRHLLLSPRKHQNYGLIAYRSKKTKQIINIIAVDKALKVVTLYGELELGLNDIKTNIHVERSVDNSDHFDLVYSCYDKDDGKYIERRVKIAKSVDEEHMTWINKVIVQILPYTQKKLWGRKYLDD